MNSRRIAEKQREALSAAQSTAPTDMVVLISGGFRSSYEALAPAFEETSGVRLIMEKSPSMGTTHDAVQQRLDRGEPADVLILVRSALEQLEGKGYVLPGSSAELALSPIGCAVKAGAAVPDISNDESFRNALLAAKLVAYSDSASGGYIQSKY